MSGRGQDGAQRWASILVGGAVLVVAAWMTLEAQPPRPVKTGVEAGAVDAAAAALPADAGALLAESDAGLALTSPLAFLDAAVLPSTGGPRSVKIGVVLVAYAGAEGAPAASRSKKDALVIAERLSGEARSDFSHAVSGGDPGSSADIGRIPRGVLDPRTEVSVFALATGDVSEILETPKGYWIVKRLE